MVCHISGSRHWVTCSANLEKNFITMYDGTMRRWTDNEKRSRIAFMIPMLRILPQVLKFSGFWECRTNLEPKYTQWAFTIPEQDNILVQNDGVNCGPFALKYVEALMSGCIAPKLTTKDLQTYCKYLAKTIFSWSTDENTLGF